MTNRIFWVAYCVGFTLFDLGNLVKHPTLFWSIMTVTMLFFACFYWVAAMKDPS